ncbi:MAG TPA: hypothetical protein VFT74_19050 [Isosphaeraceae bacterium]|nr:hypothetical protein [Isosphaeraceae bacterium]
MSVSAQQIADVLKGGVTESTPPQTITGFFQACSSMGSDLGVQWFIDTGVSSAQAANIVRSAVLERLNRGIEVAAIAASRGYLLPDSPLPRFEQINRNRQLFQQIQGVTPEEQTSLAKAVSDLVRVAIGYDDGSITFDRGQPAHQLASFEVSVDGISTQSGNALADILGYQPDADFVKRKRALDALARLDFSKRKPYLLFTADVITGGKRQNGTIVCWQRMRDASGYNVQKRDVFAIIDFPSISLSNELLERTTAELLADNDFRQVLSFYDWVHPGDVLAFVDDSTHSDTLYSYSVAGVQRRAPATGFIFDVPMSSLYLSAAQQDQVRAAIQRDMAAYSTSTDLDSVSPYPALSEVVYGDPGYGWMLAGCNVLAATRRGDSGDQVRAMSYVGSKASDILAAVGAGRISIPSDIGSVHSAVDAAIASYGVSQALLSVLDGVGLTMFSAGKDDPLGFKPTQESLEQATGGLAKILSAIDPQTASVDPHVLAAALASRTPSGTFPRYRAGQVFSSLLGKATVTPPSLDQIIGTDVIDLTTYDGIARLLQLLRTVYDFYPGSLT